ncbi:MAG: hypothetical protein V5A46_01390 [Haloferacaceae archaeon]
MVDLFGSLTREELADAVAELAFKRGTTVEDGTVQRAIDDAVASYALAAIEVDGESDGQPTRLAVGPTAFPTLPDGAADLPHILEFDADDRALDRDAVAAAVEERLRREAARAAAEGDDDRLETLLDVCFDVDVWAGTDTDGVRRDIERALE